MIYNARALSHNLYRLLAVGMAAMCLAAFAMIAGCASTPPIDTFNKRVIFAAGTGKAAADTVTFLTQSKRINLEQRDAYVRTLQGFAQTLQLTVQSRRLTCPSAPEGEEACTFRHLQTFEGQLNALLALQAVLNQLANK